MCLLLDESCRQWDFEQSMHRRWLILQWKSAQGEQSTLQLQSKNQCLGLLSQGLIRNERLPLYLGLSSLSSILNLAGISFLQINQESTRTLTGLWHARVTSSVCKLSTLKKYWLFLLDYLHLQAEPMPCIMFKEHVLFTPASLPSIADLTLQQLRTWLKGLGVVSTLVCIHQICTL